MEMPRSSRWQSQVELSAISSWVHACQKLSWAFRQLGNLRVLQKTPLNHLASLFRFLGSSLSSYPNLGPSWQDFSNQNPPHSSLPQNLVASLSSTCGFLLDGILNHVLFILIIRPRDGRASSLGRCTHICYFKHKSITCQLNSSSTSITHSIKMSYDEKKPDLAEHSDGSSSHDYDAAINALTPAEQKKLMWKIDTRLVLTLGVSLLFWTQSTPQLWSCDILTHQDMCTGTLFSCTE